MYRAALMINCDRPSLRRAEADRNVMNHHLVIRTTPEYPLSIGTVGCI